MRKRTTDPHENGGGNENHNSVLGGVIRQSQFLTDVQESLPPVNRVSLKSVLIMLLLFILFLFLCALLLHFLPSPKQFERYGYAGVFVANLLSSMGVIIPTPPGSVLTIAVAAAGHWYWAALAASAGGVLGEVTAYYVGYGGQRFLHLQNTERFQVAQRWMSRYGGLTITFFAFFPLFMFDFVGIAAGALKMPLSRFLFFCYLGRLPRAALEAYIGLVFFDWFRSLFS
ncbi:MAG: VTT domain-containing protein [Chloroflexota bacterium]|nr:VTT domain-containing protein [Chloroflexota bacterium]